MKTKTILTAALCALVLVGCGKKGADKFNEVKLDGKASTNDSIGYYLGEQMALQRVQMAQSDTLLKSAEAQAKYDEGFYAGLEAMMGDNKAFNAGFINGVTLAGQLLEQGEALNEKFDIAAVASGYAASFDKNGKAVNKLQEKATANQGKLMTMMQQLQGKAMKKQADEAIKKTAPAKKKLDAEAKKAGYTKTNGFYVKTVASGNGTKLKNGDNITAVIGFSDAAGNQIFPANPIGQTVGTGATYSPAIDALQTSLEMNGKYLIMGTVDQLFAPDMAAQAIMSGQVDPTQLYVIDYEIAPAADINVAAPAPAPAPAK